MASKLTHLIGGPQSYAHSEAKGRFMLTKKVGGFTRITWGELNENGIGLKDRPQHVGSVPYESWGEEGSANKSFWTDVEAKIQCYVDDNPEIQL